MFDLIGVQILASSSAIFTAYNMLLATNQLNEKQDIVLQLIRAQDEEGMRQLFTHYGGALMTIVQPILPQREVAEEVLHDVLLKVWNNIESYDASKSRFFTWMARIARNSAIDKTRTKNYRNNRKTDVIDDSVSRRKELSLTPSVDHIGIRSILNQLDSPHRAIIELLYLQSYTQSEAAKELDLPLGTVKTRSRRAIRQLRELLKHEMRCLLIISLLFNLLHI